LASFWSKERYQPKENPFSLLPPVSLVVMWLEIIMKIEYNENKNHEEVLSCNMKN